MKVLLWAALGVGLLTACNNGISPIGSGDAPTAKIGNAGASGGGTSSADGGTGALSTGAGAATGGSGSGADTCVATAGKDPGTGGAPPTSSCTSDADCGEAAPCQECADGTYACNKPFCKDGRCGHSGETCPAQCKLDEDCPVVGLACTDCGDGTKSCPTTHCQLGKCETSFPGCQSVDPCDGVACGAPCRQCLAGSCANSPLYCGVNGKCEPGIPKCGVGQPCHSVLDCGPPPPGCVSCSATTCAAFECVDGVCGFGCPANPHPQCKTTLDCPGLGACIKCPDNSCARRVCWKGNCEQACEPAL